RAPSVDPLSPIRSRRLAVTDTLSLADWIAQGLRPRRARPSRLRSRGGAGRPGSRPTAVTLLRYGARRTPCSAASEPLPGAWKAIRRPGWSRRTTSPHPYPEEPALGWSVRQPGEASDCGPRLLR